MRRLLDYPRRGASPGLTDRDAASPGLVSGSPMLSQDGSHWDYYKEEGHWDSKEEQHDSKDIEKTSAANRTVKYLRVRPEHVQLRNWTQQVSVEAPTKHDLQAAQFTRLFPAAP